MENTQRVVAKITEFPWGKFSASNCLSSLWLQTFHANFLLPALALDLMKKRQWHFFHLFSKETNQATSGDPLKKPIFLTRCCPVVWHPSASYWNHFWGVILTLSRERICNFPTRSFFPSVCLHFRALFTLAIVMCSRKWRFCEICSVKLLVALGDLKELKVARVFIF